MSFHIEAKAGEIAETILLPGDPMRAKYVAENMLQDSICFNRVRGMYGFTGNYEGKRVSIMGTGMGMPSVAVYVNELIKEYGVKTLIRVGTCGAIQKDLDIGQVILVTSASGDSHANRVYFEGMDFAATATFSLLHDAYEASKKLNINALQGSIFSTDIFYDSAPNRWDKWREHNILAVEMETQMLYTLAAKLDARALSILTVSDNIVTGKASSHQEREQNFNEMMQIALSVA